MQTPSHFPATATHVRAAACALLFTVAAIGAPAAFAQEASPMHHSRASKAHYAKHETIDERISKLHAELKITSEQETLWSAVAQTMHDNEDAMQKLAADEHAKPEADATALDDLAAYQKFAQAHVDGLAKLSTSFEALYKAMPAEQQKLADHVFASFGHEASHKRA